MVKSRLLTQGSNATILALDLYRYADYSAKEWPPQDKRLQRKHPLNINASILHELDAKFAKKITSSAKG
jgi:hypothetical protein